MEKDPERIRHENDAWTGEWALLFRGSPLFTVERLSEAGAVAPETPADAARRARCAALFGPRVRELEK